MNGSTKIQNERRLFQGVNVDRLRVFGVESVDLLSDTPLASVIVDIVGANETVSQFKKRLIAQMSINAGNTCGFGVAIIARAETSNKYIDVEAAKVEEVFTTKCGDVLWDGWFKPRNIKVGTYLIALSRKIREDLDSERKLPKFKENNFPWKPWENEHTNEDVDLTVQWEWSDGQIPHPHQKPKFGELSVNTLMYGGQEYGCMDIDLIFGGANFMAFADLKANGQTARPAQRYALEKMAKYASLTQGYGAAIIAEHDVPTDEEIDAADAEVTEFELFHNGRLTDYSKNGTSLYETLRALGN